VIAEQQKLFDFVPDEINGFDFILFDRIEKIKSIINQYGEENFYLSFSGGKDSTVLHYLLDMALPGNDIPRVFSNTGLEFRLIYKFVKSLQDKDKRIIMISPRKNIVKTLERVGYPFKSKEHSKQINQWKRGSKAKSVLYYKNMQGKTKFACPKTLLYQYEDDFKLKISDRCCYEFKKDTVKKWEKESKKTIVLTGMRKSEGGQRSNMNCTVFKEGNLVKFHPLAVISDKWEDWFIDKFNIRLCDLYYYPYNFDRTGCVGCPFNINIKKDLEIIKEKLPNEYKRAWLYFGKVYEEYKRIGYRL
jgi:3'-phosphoadenosine 5'-phosphosulfate sulfotransferase (PAPS reductase)/FAD synthetase